MNCCVFHFQFYICCYVVAAVGGICRWIIHFSFHFHLKIWNRFSGSLWCRQWMDYRLLRQSALWLKVLKDIMKFYVYVQRAFFFLVSNISFFCSFHLFSGLSRLTERIAHFQAAAVECCASKSQMVEHAKTSRLSVERWERGKVSRAHNFWSSTSYKQFMKCMNNIHQWRETINPSEKKNISICSLNLTSAHLASTECWVWFH